MSAEDQPLSAVASLLNDSGVDYALIGGHAVNVWLEPRFTADIDVTISADAASVAELEDILARSGYTKAAEYGANLPSGPDFVRWVSTGGIILEAQLAKTALQEEVIRRAVVAESGMRVATCEDLIVLKLIADRSKDRVDLEGLCALGDVDWTYVERWAKEWEVFERLERFRNRELQAT